MKNLKNYLFLLLFPFVLGLYAISLRISNQGFQDIIAVLMAFVTVVGSIIAWTLRLALVKTVDVNKWYVNLILGFAGIGIAMLILIAYSRMVS